MSDMCSILKEQANEINKMFLQPIHQNEKLSFRVYSENNRARSDGEFQRDYTRILYASSFRRLQGKMQLFAVQSDQFIRNRLTHSLEVAQIARSIAKEIGYDQNEIYVVEAAALAHDIGNPPFGHAGERYLNKLAKDAGGFEGNAQTFRILTTVEQKRADFQGLNLTYRTLLGVLKYFNKYNQNLSDKLFAEQKFIYDKDYELVTRILNNTGVELRTIDVQIVDLADEIAYAAHDLEDGLRLGSFTLDDIYHEFYKDSNDKNSIKCLESIIYESKEKAGYKNKSISSSEFSKLYRKEVTSRIINTLINDIGIIELSNQEKKKKGTNGDKEIGFVTYGELARGLKKTTYDCITNTDEVYAYEQQGEKMMKILYNFYLKNPRYLPPEYRTKSIISQYKDQYLEEEKDAGLEELLKKRLVIDYISGMMDEYVKTTYKKLTDNIINNVGVEYE